jgi:hypothetical protein
MQEDIVRQYQGDWMILDMNARLPKTKRCWLAILVVILLAACAPTTTTLEPMPVTATAATVEPTPTASTAMPNSTATGSGGNSIAIIEVSDPLSSTYDPKSAAYADFPAAVKQLAAMNPSADIDVAGELAYAMAFPRADSYLAAQALISLGPDWAATALPVLIDNLKNQRPEVRLYSALVLSFIGKPASCAVGNISPLLWDADPYVRTSAAIAIESITGEDLVPKEVVITPNYSSDRPVTADTPEGTVVAAARSWWTDQGLKVNWHPSYDICDP